MSEEMTREQAIEELSILLNKYQDSVTGDALDMVIAEISAEPCEDAISRQAAINVASGYCHSANVAKELAKLPSVNPQPKTGHWQDLTGLFFCSECDGGFAKPWHYCPNCGAKMESEDRHDR